MLNKISFLFSLNHFQNKTQYQLILRFCYLLLIGLIPLIFMSCWLLKNTQLPGSDATDYIGSAFATYQHMIEKGWQHFEWQRGWRPIFFPFLLIPFLLLSSGNVFFSYHAVAIVCLLFSVWYVYLLLRLELDRVSALISANLIGILPFIQAPILTFFAESALFPCLLASIYHLIQSNFLRHNKHTVGFIISTVLAICIRPVEAATHLFLVVCGFLFLGIHNKVFSIGQVIKLFTLASFFIFTFCFLLMTHFLDHYPSFYIDGSYYDIKLAKTLYHVSILTFSMLITITVGYYLYRKNINAKQFDSTGRLIATFTIIFTLTFIWYAPYAFQTFLWVYRTSIGDLAMQDTARVSMHWSSSLIGFVFQEGIFSVSIVILTCLLALGFNAKIVTKKITSQLIIYLLLAVPFSIWEVIFTIQNTPRKLSVTFPVLLMMFLVIALQRGRLWWLRKGMVTTALFVQSFMTYAIIYPQDNVTRQLNLLLGSYPLPVLIQPNPHQVILNFLADSAKEYSLKKVAIEVNINESMPVDVFLLHLMGMLAKQPFSIGYPHFSDASDHVKKMSHSVDAIFLSDRMSDMLVSKASAKFYIEKYQLEKNPTIKTMYQLLYYFAQNKLGELGWQRGPCLILKAADQRDYLGCLLIPLRQVSLDKKKYNVKIPVS